ncbi:MAG TPA: dienelactone hydrolase family protein [Pyrinomonadaceae bacterium]|nr:dienelactone hydrolase family protein [Pyrinomonadaceae bacterium]
MWSVLGGLLSAAAPSKGGRLETRTARVGANDYAYQVHAPASAGDSPPVIVFLHGIGQRGSGGFLPESGAAAVLVRRYLARVPAVVLLPQCRAGSYWSDPFMDEMVMTALSQTESEFKADDARLYLTGVSMGGYGVWHLASGHPGRFAALVSVCGGVHGRDAGRFDSVAEKVGETPAWLFHGADDRVVPVTESRQMTAALKGVGGNVKYSEYPGVGHAVWTQVFAERGLMPWLLSQRRAPDPSLGHKS